MTAPSMLVLVLIGLLSGGAINYLAYKLLRTEDPFSGSPSYLDCSHKLYIWGSYSVIFIFLFCQKLSITCRRRLFLEYPLVEIITTGAFLALAWRFHISSYSVGMMIFVAVLITVCITDFKAKIIPHDITYPAIILGIMFSAQIRCDALGALAGIGISYIAFDFLAFYGLQIYIWLNKPTSAPSQQWLSTGEKSASQKTARAIILVQQWHFTSVSNLLIKVFPG